LIMLGAKKEVLFIDNIIDFSENQGVSYVKFLDTDYLLID